jgi:type III secretion system low calcium response chaperone LcrH/SycD
MTPQASPSALEKIPDQIADLLSTGGLIGDIFDLSELDYEAVYALGHNLYSQARYSDAMRTFGFLVIHNHLEKRFMNAFASSLQMLENYQEAIKYYSFASIMDMSDPLPTYHTAECMIALGYIKEAKEALQFVKTQAGEQKQTVLLNRAQAMFDLLDKSSH